MAETETMSSAAPGERRALGGLAKHFAIYSAAPFLRQLIAIAMTHLYTEWLREEGMGVKGVVDLWMVGLQNILGLNALGAMVRFYFDRKSERDRAATVSSCTLLLTGLSWLVCGTLFLFREPLTPLLLDDAGVVGGNDLVAILGLMLLLIPFQMSTQSGLYYLMATQRSAQFTVIQTAKLLFEIALNFILLGHLGWGVEGFLISMLTGEALTSLLLCGWMYRRLGARFDLDILRPILAYAAPLIPVGLCQLALHSLDRRLLVLLDDAGTTGFAVAGVYDHGYKIGFLVTAMLLAPFNQIFHPWIYGIEDPQERSEHVAKVSTWAVLVIAAASVGVTLFGRQAAVILGGQPGFWEAWRVIPWIAGGYVFWALYSVSQIPLYIAKRTGRLFFINLGALVLNVLANLVLIPRLGFVGAGVATAITFCTLAGMGMLASRSEAHVPFELGRLARVLVGVVVAGALALWIDRLEVTGELGLVTAIGAKALVCATLLGGYWLFVLHHGERRGLLTWLQTRRRALGI